MLYIDSYSAYDSTDVLLLLENNKVSFLPPNVKSLIQSPETRIVATVKVEVLRRPFFRVFENIEVGKNQATIVTYLRPFNGSLRCGICWALNVFSIVLNICFEGKY